MNMQNYLILLPLTAPGFVTTGLLAFMNAWNEFLYVLTFTIRDTAANGIGDSLRQQAHSLPAPIAIKKPGFLLLVPRPLVKHKKPGF